ncbi:DNA-binding transcriptional regulator, LysR family [Rhizobiales bacterium GAS113]|nr:DNA-binding transcriptional regulator, LysR family [Rhizobiales bacterium GAS113]
MAWRTIASRCDLRTIELCLTVLDAQSFRKAAEQSLVRQSAISRRVRGLEETLGVTLFERSPRGVRATATGAEFLRAAQRFMGDLERAVIEAREREKALEGHLTIGSYLTLHTGRLTESIAEFAARAPDTSIQFVDSDRATLLSGLRSRVIDVAFLINFESHPASEGRLILWNESIHVAISDRHRLASASVCRWQEIVDEIFLVSRSGSGPDVRAGIEGRFSELGVVPNIQTHDIGRDGLLGLVAAGMGTTVLAESSTNLAPNGVVCLPVVEASEPLRLGAMACWDPLNENPALKRFLDYMRERYPPLPTIPAGRDEAT